MRAIKRRYHLGDLFNQLLIISYRLQDAGARLAIAGGAGCAVAVVAVVVVLVLYLVILQLVLELKLELVTEHNDHCDNDHLNHHSHVYL